MITFEQDIRNEYLLKTAQAILAAARTAPKARGIDHLSLALVTGSDIESLVAEMEREAGKGNWIFFSRDAKNILQSGHVILLGTKIAAIGLNCGYCGFPTCEAKNKSAQVPCFFNAHDLGIAIGSAVSVSSNARIDNRVMFSVGFAAKKLNLMPDSDIILGIPLSISSKSPFFDRS